MSTEELKLCENERLYPPRFVVTIRGLSSAKDSCVAFTFEGATTKIVKKSILNTKGIVYVMWMLAQHHKYKSLNYGYI